MERAALIGLLDTCVQEFDSDGVEDLLPQLSEHLPALLQSATEADFQFLTRAARLVAFVKEPQPRTIAINLLLDIAAAHVPRGVAAAAIPFVERAHDLAEEAGLKSELRRACNVYAALSTEAGAPARGLEYSIKAAELAHQLGFNLGVAAAFSNMTAALFAMGLYRETIAVALRTCNAFKSDANCASLVANARGNLASASLALAHYSLASESAREACAVLGLPRDAHGLLNRVITENVWLKAAIGQDDRVTIEARMAFIRSVSSAFKLPRLQVNHAIAEAAYEMYAGDLTVAVAKLLELQKHTKSMPNLYRDNLALLVKAYERGGDHGGALLFLGELVEFLREKQVSAVKASLDAIQERYQTRLPGKDDVREVITALQKRQGTKFIRAEVPEQAYRESFERLAVSAEMKEDVGGRHAYRMGRLAGLLARKLGYDRKFCEEVEKGARLHDIGKLGIPDGLLLKAGELTPAEWAVMKRHTQIGAQIIRQCPHPAFRVGEQIALCHHEKWDGSGYPKGLRGDNIPVPARIVMLADVYDALTHARPYKHAWTHDEVVAYITERAGSQFDPNFAQLFVAMANDLRRDHGDGLDDYLAEPSKQSSFIQARDRMQEMLSEMAPLQPGEFL